MKTLFQQLKQQWVTLPRGAHVLLYTEICELYGRFGIIALLVLYLTHALHASDQQAFGLFAGFITMLYALPVVGGYVADRFLGPIVAVLLGIVFMMVGNGCLVWPHLADASMGLMLIAVGAAIFTPTLSAMLHHLYGDRPQDHDTGFMLYYLARNMGALLAPMVGGVVAKYHGYAIAFVMNLLVMASGFLVFCIYRKRFFRGDLGERCAIKQAMAQVHPWVKRQPIWGVLAVTLIGVLAALVLDSIIDSGRAWLLVCFAVAFAVGLLCQIVHAKWLRPQVLMEMILAFVAVGIFNMFLWQGGTTLNLFIDRLVNRTVWGVEWPTTFFYTLNPLFMLTIGPLLFMYLRRVACRLKARAVIQQYALGLGLLGVGFLVYCVAAHGAQHGLVSPWFVVVAYCLFPLGELALMPTALSYVTQRAPSGSTATMAGFLSLSVAIASYGTGWLSSWASASSRGLHHAALAMPYFRVFAFSSGCLLLSAALFGVYSVFLKAQAES